LILEENNVFVKGHCSRFWYSGRVPVSQSARARVRAEISAEIIAAARAELIAGGTAGLSLRAVARRLEMVPSALYRYFPSREALLTALIIDAYEAVAAAARAADEAQDAPAARWLAVARATRRWAGEHPQEWSLIYGSPVVGYAAPEETVPAALRITEVIAGICRAAVPAGSDPPDYLPPAPSDFDVVLGPMRDLLFPGRAPEVVAAALVVWTHLIGVVSLELFGHYKGATTEFDRVFDYTIEMVGKLVGL
jgi:AcrR family transcriptional regulator